MMPSLPQPFPSIKVPARRIVVTTFRQKAITRAKKSSSKKLKLIKKTKASHLSSLTLAIDAMGGDFGPPVIVPAAIRALRQHKDLHLVLVGDYSILQPEI